MATACRFCTQCLFLESVGLGDFGGGRLIYIPELKQEQLNSFCHVIFCAMHNETNYNDSARTLYRDLKFRSRPIEKKFGEGTNKPHVFCQMLIEQETEKLPLKSLLDKTLKGVLLLPAFAKFAKELEDWSKAAADILQEK